MYAIKEYLDQVAWGERTDGFRFIEHVLDACEDIGMRPPKDYCKKCRRYCDYWEDDHGN